MALMGSYSLLAFKKGASILKSAVCVIPSYPPKKEIIDIELTEKGELKRSPYPNGWDDYDWKVYHAMRQPNRSYGKVGGEIGSCWTTVRDHFRKILKDCDIWLSFYPKGYETYQKAILTFETKYETNLKEELSKIDRSTFLFKFNEKIILHLTFTHYSELRTFEIFKKERKIKNLRFSMPITHQNIF
jgi:hypothetical protein